MPGFEVTQILVMTASYDDAGAPNLPTEIAESGVVRETPAQLLALSDEALGSRLRLVVRALQAKVSERAEAALRE
jgi:hypothetical protein